MLETMEFTPGHIKKDNKTKSDALSLAFPLVVARIVSFNAVLPPSPSPVEDESLSL